MHSSLVPPRQIKIGDAASFVGTTQRAIRHYHEIGLLPEPERGTDDRRLYGYDEIIQLLWIRKMADAGISLADIRVAFSHEASEGADTDDHITSILERLEQTLAHQEAETRRQRTAVRRMRTLGSRMGLLSDIVARRFECLSESSLRQADLDSLLVNERIFGPLGAAVQATRFIILATHPGLQEESDRVDTAEKALDDTIAVDDPRVAQVANERYRFELMLQGVIEDSGLGQSDEALFEAWDALYPATDDKGEDETGRRPRKGQGSMSAMEVAGRMPYDFSPARLRCTELVEEFFAGISTP